MKAIMFGVCNINRVDLWDITEFKKQIGKEILHYNLDKRDLKILGKLSGVSYIKRVFNPRGEEICRTYLPYHYAASNEIVELNTDIRPYLEFDNGVRIIPKSHLEIYYAR